MEDKVILTTEKYEALVEQALKAKIIEDYAFEHASDWDISGFVKAIFGIKKVDADEN